MPSLPLYSTRWRFPLIVVPDHKNIHTQTTEEKYDDNSTDSITIHHNGSKRSLYCMLLKQTLQFQIELSRHFHNIHRFCGSSHGWLIASIVDDHDILHISLFDPFSTNPNISNNLIINLPPITENINEELTYYREYLGHCKNTLDLYHNHYVHKAVLSCDPSSSPDDYIVMVIYGGYGRLAFIRPGTDPTWTYLDNSIYQIPMSDAIYYKGKVFAIDAYGMVVCCEAENNNWTARMFSGVQSMYELYATKYLVESVDNELLQIHRLFNYNDNEPHYSARATVTGFKVFKLKDDNDFDSDSSNCCDKWLEMQGIGDCALFVGVNGCTSLRASDIGGCSSNSIYFLPDKMEHTNPMCDPVGYTDMGVFHFEDGSIDPINYMTSAMSSQTPIWITTVKEDLDLN